MEIINPKVSKRVVFIVLIFLFLLKTRNCAVYHNRDTDVFAYLQ